MEEYRGKSEDCTPRAAYGTFHTCNRSARKRKNRSQVGWHLRPGTDCRNFNRAPPTSDGSPQRLRETECDMGGAGRRVFSENAKARGAGGADGDGQEKEKVRR